MTFERNSTIKGDVFLQNYAACSSGEHVERIHSVPSILAKVNQLAVISDEDGLRGSSGNPCMVESPLLDQPVETKPSVVGGSRKNQSIFDLLMPCEGPARVLVADDNLLVRVCLMNLLEQWGMTFHICTNGQDAWNALQESAFDLVLIDLQMPGMDGHEVVEHLRTAGSCENRNIPVIALAGTDCEEAKGRMFDVGTNEFLTKPFCPEQLSHTLHKHLKTSASQQSQLFTDIIDQQQLSNLYEDDYEHMHYMFSLFIKNTALSLKTIDKAVGADDLASLEREVHKVKPTFAMVGLQKTGQLAGKIEAQLQGVNHLSTNIRSDLQYFRQSIKEGLQLVLKKQQSIANYLK